MKGKFIVIDGLDGCGKSTQIPRLAERLSCVGFVTTYRDPGATPIAERIREIVLNGHVPDICSMCEMALFMACRAELMAKEIQPELMLGVNVLLDRWVSSTCAYQAALGISPLNILTVANIVCRGVWPDLTIILDIPPEEAYNRIQRSGKQLDFLEKRGKEYFTKVRRLYLELPERAEEVSFDIGRIVILDALKIAEDLEQEIWDECKIILG